MFSDLTRIAVIFFQFCTSYLTKISNCSVIVIIGYSITALMYFSVLDMSVIGHDIIIFFVDFVLSALSYKVVFW